ncbi:aldehyde dehydrogenase [Paraburkholderia caribensis]|uniref:aldehyde dehydrogenase n=1 Tax=Paraburkholderia caribensis TaxID=75105 RepID=UPI000721E1A3|nr:aldehyde dehydrogenase [Paraburkholderia caribensis]ALP68686.1 aldehyde dehydrogenase [Paraburkholderia caribensis]AUT58051.1 aldehyde dehydrogenase [Paraburkholderia caribensis]
MTTSPFDPQSELNENVRSRFYIRGDWVLPNSTGTVSIVSPTTEQPFLSVPLANHRDVDAAVLAARKAFDTGPWPRMSAEERSVYLRRMSTAIASRLPLLSRLWTAEVGAPLWFANMFTPTATAMLDYYAELSTSFAFEERRSTRGGHARIVRQPVGVTGLIAPWNAQLPILAYKLGAALAAGCTVVVKAPPETPLDALVVAECAHEAGLPPGVLNVITADADCGAYLVAKSEVDKISFTGSTATGKIIAKSCAERTARVTLELGGKSAAIVLEDAGLESTLAALAPFTMPFSGQICFAQTRILVPRSREREFVEAYSAAIAALKVGDPWEATTQIGPLANRRQFERVLRYIDVGLSDGAQITTGGTAGDHRDVGFFIEPTVFSGVTPAMTIAREEIFGPVVAVMAYDDVNQAIAIANDTDFGLSGSVFTNDVERGYDVARRIRAGNVSVNGLEMSPNVPFGGFKQSGIGREGGPEGLSAFLEDQAIYMPSELQSAKQV